MVKKIEYFLFTLAFLLLSPTAIHGASGKFVVVIDAGHGGHDPGAIGKTAREKNINLRTALEVGRLIESKCNDVQVIYTRKTDVFVKLERRAQIANNAKADLFISIHTNALPKGKICRGAETYTLGMARANENLEVAKKENSVILMEDDYKATYKGFNPNSAESYIIFEFMQDKNMTQSVNFSKKLQQQFKGSAGRIDRGVHQAGFLVLRETSMPSVLIELGYISTPDEENFLNSSEGTACMARAIYNAFVSYKNNTRNLLTPYAPLETVEAPTPATNEPPILVAESVANDSFAQDEQTKNNIQEEKAKPATRQRPTPIAQKTETDAPIFMIQILTSSTQLKTNDKRMKGLTDVDYYKEGGLYKYTCAASTNYNTVLKAKKEINDKFADSFIIAFRNGEKINVNEAIRIFKNRK